MERGVSHIIFWGCLSWLVVVCLGVAGFWCTCIQYRQCPNCFVHIGSIGNTCTYNRQYRQHGQYKQYTQHRQFRVYRQYIYTYTYISNVFIYTYISKAHQSVIYALPAARPSGPPPAVRPPAPGRPAGVLRPPHMERRVGVQTRCRPTCELEQLPALLKMHCASTSFK